MPTSIRAFAVRTSCAPLPFLLAASLAVAIMACSETRMSPGLETTILPTQIDYACEDGRTLRVVRAGDANSATATTSARSWTLQRVESAAQEKYAQGATALYLDGEIAMLESDGRVVAAQCRSSTPMPKVPAMRPYKF